MVFYKSNVYARTIVAYTNLYSLTFFTCKLFSPLPYMQSLLYQGHKGLIGFSFKKNLFKDAVAMNALIFFWMFTK